MMLDAKQLNKKSRESIDVFGINHSLFVKLVLDADFQSICNCSSIF